PVGMYLAFGDEDNSGDGYKILSYAPSTGVLTFQPVLAGNVDADAEIAPIVPTPSFSGTILQGTNNGLSIGGTSVGFISYKDEIATGIVPLDREANSDRPTGLELGAPR